MKKICTKCKRSQELTDFTADISRKDKLYPQCKQCVRKRQQQPSNKKQKKIYAEKNSLRIAEYFKNRYQIKKIEYNEKQKLRRISNIEFRLATNLRTRLNSAIKNDQKVGSAVEDLGCSIPELKVHLESKFQPGMTWENHAKKGWHIDHIIPLKAFDLTDRNEFLIANHYLNLQPLWAKPNLEKSDILPTKEFCDNLIKTIKGRIYGNHVRKEERQLSP